MIANRRVSGEHLPHGWAGAAKVEPADPTGDLHRRTIDGLNKKWIDESEEMGFVHYIPRGESLDELLTLMCPVCGAVVDVQHNPRDVRIVEHVRLLDQCPASGWTIENASE